MCARRKMSLRMMAIKSLYSQAEIGRMSGGSPDDRYHITIDLTSFKSRAFRVSGACSEALGPEESKAASK